MFLSRLSFVLSSSFMKNGAPAGMLQLITRAGHQEYELSTSRELAAPAAQKASAKPKKATPKKKETDNKIKKAPSAFNLYMKENLSSFKAQHPEILKHTDLLRPFSQQWKNLPDSDREQYVQASNEARSQRQEVVAKAKANKRPPSAFAAYVKEKMATLPKDQPVPARMKIIAQMWKVRELLAPSLSPNFAVRDCCQL